MMTTPPPTTRDSADFQLHEIEVNVEGDDPDAVLLVNGVYTRLRPENQWRSEKYPFKNAAKTIQSATIFEKWNRISDHQTTLNRLTHRIKGGNHTWELRSYHLETLFEGQKSYDLTASIETVRWKPLFPGLEPLDVEAAALEDIRAKTKQFEIFGPPHIRSVVLDYKKKSDDPDWSDRRQHHTVLLAPYVRIQDDSIYFRINAAKNRVDGIVAKLEPMFSTNESRCKTNPNRARDPVYLELRPLQIKSDVLGGKMDGRAHVFFRNQQDCDNWVLAQAQILDHVLKVSEKSDRKIHELVTEPGLDELRILLKEKWFGAIRVGGRAFEESIRYNIPEPLAYAARVAASQSRHLAGNVASRARSVASGAARAVAGFITPSRVEQEEGP